MGTKPSITLNYSDGWVNVNTLSNVTAGTAFFVQNNGKHFILASESPTQPTNSSSSFMIYPSEEDNDFGVPIASGAQTLWVFNPKQGTPISLSVTTDHSSAPVSTMGIGTYDLIEYTYGQGGGTSESNIIRLDYYLGEAGTLVGTVVLAYNLNNLVISKERTA
tara:strand:+ start:291 stop:779 length:489 start_codon:yes stop_codon:yes gene_type:complete